MAMKKVSFKTWYGETVTFNVRPRKRKPKKPFNPNFPPPTTSQ